MRAVGLANYCTQSVHSVIFTNGDDLIHRPRRALTERTRRPNCKNRSRFRVSSEQGAPGNRLDRGGLAHHLQLDLVSSVMKKPTKVQSKCPLQRNSSGELHADANLIPPNQPLWQGLGVNRGIEKVIEKRCNRITGREYYLGEASLSSGASEERNSEDNQDTGASRTQRSAILNTTAAVGIRIALADAAKE